MKSRGYRQRVQNTAARLVTKCRKDEHVKPVLRDLHWLPVQQRIAYKIALLTYKALHGLAPTYISELIEEYQPKRTLRSASQFLLCTRPPKLCKTKYYGERSFAAKVWNKLPSKLSAVSNINSLKKGLKTHFVQCILSNMFDILSSVCNTNSVLVLCRVKLWHVVSAILSLTYLVCF